jgi:hypothetical protein
MVDTPNKRKQKQVAKLAKQMAKHNELDQETEQVYVDG